MRSRERIREIFGKNTREVRGEYARSLPASREIFSVLPRGLFPAREVSRPPRRSVSVLVLVFFPCACARICIYGIGGSVLGSPWRVFLVFFSCFFEKSRREVWRFGKVAVPLHPLSGSVPVRVVRGRRPGCRRVVGGVFIGACPRWRKERGH